MSTTESNIADQTLENRVLTLFERAKATKIMSPEDYVAACNFVLDLKAMMTEIDEGYDSIIAAAHKTHKDAIAKKKKYYDPVDQSVRLVGPMITRWDLEQKRIQDEETMRLQKIEDDRAKELQLKTAVALDEMGEKGQADRVLNETPWSAPIVTPRAAYVPPVAGVSKPRDNWKAEVTDLMALVKAIAAGGPGAPPIQCLQANDVFLGQQARSMKNTLAYPGVKVSNNPSTNFSSGRR
jgi:hypothetical protein